MALNWFFYTDASKEETRVVLSSCGILPRNLYATPEWVRKIHHQSQFPYCLSVVNLDIWNYCGMCQFYAKHLSCYPLVTYSLVSSYIVTVGEVKTKLLLVIILVSPFGVVLSRDGGPVCASTRDVWDPFLTPL